MVQTHSEALEWKLYEFFSIFAFLSFFCVSYVIKRFPSLLKYYSKLFILNFAVIVAFIVFLFESKTYNVRHFLFLLLALIPFISVALYNLHKSVHLSWDHLKLIHTSLWETLSINILLVVATLSFFFVDFDHYPIPFTYLLLLITVIVSVALLILNSRMLSRVKFPHNTKLFYLLLIFPLAFYICQAPIEYHHYSFFVGPIFDVIKGKSLLSETPSQYGYLSIHFLVFMLEKIGVSFNTFNFVNITLFALYYSFAGYLFFKLLKSIVAASVFTIVFMLMQTFFSHYTYVLLPSTGPIRFGIVMIVFGIFVFFSKRAQTVLSAIGASISLFWSPETAVYVIPAWFFACLVISYLSTNTRKEFILSFLHAFRVFFVFSLLIFVYILLFEYSHFHVMPQLMNFFAYVSSYQDGSGSILMPLYENYYFALLINLLGLATVAHFVIRKIRARYLPALSFISISNVALLSYYIGRSHENNIVNIAGFLLLELVTVYAVVREYYSIKFDRIKHIFAVPIAIFLVLFSTRVINQFPPRNTYLWSIFKPNIVGWLRPSPQPSILLDMLEEETINNKPVVVLDEKLDTMLLVDSNIKNELPLNPAIMTTLLYDWKSKYVDPKIQSLTAGTVIVLDPESQGSSFIWEDINRRFILKPVGEKEQYRISQIISRRVN